MLHARLILQGTAQSMEIRDWNERYRLRERPAEDFDAAPTPLVVAAATKFAPWQGARPLPAARAETLSGLRKTAGKSPQWTMRMRPS